MGTKSILVKSFLEKKCYFKTFTYYHVTIKILFEIYFSWVKTSIFCYKKNLTKYNEFIRKVKHVYHVQLVEFEPK